MQQEVEIGLAPPAIAPSNQLVLNFASCLCSISQKILKNKTEWTGLSEGQLAKQKSEGTD